MQPAKPTEDAAGLRLQEKNLQLTSDRSTRCICFGSVENVDAFDRRAAVPRFAHNLSPSSEKTHV